MPHVRQSTDVELLVKGGINLPGLYICDKQLIGAATGPTGYKHALEQSLEFRAVGLLPEAHVMQAPVTFAHDVQFVPHFTHAFCPSLY